MILWKRSMWFMRCFGSVFLSRSRHRLLPLISSVDQQVCHFVHSKKPKVVVSSIIPSRSLCEMATDTKAHRYQTHPILVWVDCEMTGLEIEKDRLLEVAIILTDSDLNEVDTLGPLHIQTSQDVLDNMNDWCKKNHKKSGLTEACLKSQLTMEDADQQLFDLLTKYGIKRAGLAGNSVSYDRIFLAKWCPKFSSLLHYRNLDVSSFKEIVRRWYPEQQAFRKKLVHRALEDIRESVAEMKFYQKAYFKSKEEVAKTLQSMKEDEKGVPEEEAAQEEK